MKTKIFQVAILVIAMAVIADEYCEIGNHGDPVGPPLTDVLHGNDAYAYLVKPGQECGGTDDNAFRLIKSHMLLHFDTQQIPADFSVRTGLLKAVPEGTNRFTPGEEIYLTQNISVHVDQPGPFQLDIETPDFGLEELDDEYFLVFKFTSFVEGNLPIDSYPEAGVAYRFNGTSWEDMDTLDRRPSGKIILWGDIVCVVSSVDSDTNSWGKIKAMFR
jgi:hypothetical protein